MKLYNTLSRASETFAPTDGKTVGMYVCGPTVYDHIHIGNARPIIVFDTLRRYMEAFKAWTVIHVQNITDVDDKLIARSAETGEPVDSIAESYTNAYFDLLEKLQVLRPTHSPRATEHIHEMIDLIERLVAEGLAYEQAGDVYFRVASDPEYGKLSGRSLDDQEAGARVQACSLKENPLDFTLWKAAKPGEPKWASPWGEGRPGWHTECVVLSYAFLEDHRDIHAGGNDLVFPHHENEIAQAEGVYGCPFFRFWLHNGMLSLEGEKMAKSTGNFEYAKDVLDRFDTETVRYFYLSRHYRKPLAYSEAGLHEAEAAVGRIRSLIDDVDAEFRSGAEGAPAQEGRSFLDSLDKYRDRYIAAMDDDLNTVGAIGAIQEIVAEANRFRRDAEGADRLALIETTRLIRELGVPLGLFNEDDATSTAGIEDDLVSLLLELRESLRNKKEFELADRVRDRLGELGIVLKDGPNGTIWSKSG